MLVAAVLVAASLTLTDRPTVMLASSSVRLGDVAAGDPRLARIVIARLPRGKREIALSRRALAALVRRAVPGVAVGGAEQGGSVVLRAPVVAPPVRLAPARLPEPPTVRVGDELKLISRSGPVTVERTVTALQPGRSGRPLFVRDAAGNVSSIQFFGERTR